MTDKTALITGISGQDGSYLAELLLGRGFEVYGVVRRPVTHHAINMTHLDDEIESIHSSFELASLFEILDDVRPQEIYNFAGQTYVGKSWEMLDETVKASAIIPCDLLEAIARIDRRIRFFQASSCEMFSASWQDVISETTPLAPATPYGCAKAMAHNMVACYRQKYGIYAVSGILFNHESPRRNDNFVSRKLVKQAVSIKLGREREIVLGNIEVVRDWSFAPDVVTAIDRSMRLDAPSDFVICSGETHSVREMLEVVFDILDLDLHDHLRIDKSLFRSGEAPVIRGSNEKARAMLGWQPKTLFRQMLQKMVAFEMALQTGTAKNFADERPFA